MITFRLRSICRSSFSVSMPLISGIRTSKMMTSGRSPLLIFSIASGPLLNVSTSKPSTSSSVCKYFRMLGSSSTTRIFSFTAIAIPHSHLASTNRLLTARSATENEIGCHASTRSPPKSCRDVPAPAFSQSPVRGPCRMYCDPPAQNLQKFPDCAPAQFQTQNLKRSLPHCSGAATETDDVLGSALPLPRRAAPKNVVLQQALRSHPMVCRSEEHTSELQSPCNLVCRLLLEKKK